MQNELITTDFEAEVKKLEKEILNIEMRQTELQQYISDLEYANNGLKIIIKKETDSQRKSKYYEAIRRNIELLTKLYASYKDFELVKFNYRKEISTLTQNRNRMIHIDLPKASPGSISGPEELFSVFKIIAETMKNSESKQDLIEKIGVKDEQYDL